METTANTHASAVDAWLIRASRTGSSRALIASFQGALSRIWARAVRTLGSVTLDAIAKRVLGNAIDRNPVFAAIEPRGRVSCDELQLEERLENVPFAELVLGIRASLIELLTVLGSMTAGVLTRELHAELARSHRAPARRRDRDSYAGPP
jgi:hypothetical protein